MSSNGDQTPSRQQTVGAIFFILPLALIGVFLFWCWRRYRESSREAHWADLSVGTPGSMSLEALPELHSAFVHAFVQLEGSIKLRWSDMKPVFASFATDDDPDSGSSPTVRVGVLVRMPSREPINTSEHGHLRSGVLLGSTIPLHLLD